MTNRRSSSHLERHSFSALLRYLAVVGLLALATTLFGLAFSAAPQVDVWLSWFLIGVGIGWLVNRWWALSLSLVPFALAWVGSFLVRPPTAPTGEPEFGWLGLVFFICLWGVAPGLGGIAVGVALRRARAVAERRPVD